MTGLAHHVLDALPVTVQSVDLDGRITDVNRPGSPADAPPPQQLEPAMALLRAGRTDVVRWETTDRDGRVRLVQLTPLHEGHAVAGFVLATVDVTGSVRAREALLDAALALARAATPEQLWRELAAQARRVLRGDALVVALAEGSGDTPRVVHVVGHAEDADALAQRLAPAWRDAIAGVRVVRTEGPAGPELTAPLSGAEGVHGAITLRADDAEGPQRLAEAQRAAASLAALAAAALERARLAEREERRRRLHAIGDAAASVAHELRNPLFGISSAAQLLRFRAREDPVLEKNIGRIQREVERLNRLVASLLAYGQPEALQLRPGDPDAVWDEVVQASQGLLESRALCLRRTRPRKAAHCRLDAEQLGHVFTHVLTNAVEAAPEASDLVLTSETRPDGGWRCRLTNGGPPIPPDALARAFEIFFSTKAGGTGVGLALSQRIVEAHHGVITLESTAEHGTTVTIELPTG